METDELRGAIDTYLAPLLSAKVLTDLMPCTNRTARVAYLEPSKIAIKANIDSLERVVLYRNPGFTREERRLIDDFIEELTLLHNATGPAYRDDLFLSLPSRALARHLGGGEALKIILRQFERWAARTYEGGAITSSIGIDPNAIPKEILLENIFQHDFSAVLSNGYDTLLVATSNGHISGSGQLTETQLGTDFVPYRLNSISEWCIDQRIALVLNRLGEQLIFKNKKLIFAKRRGEWQYYAHEMYIKMMQPPQSLELRVAIYQSCLDISYSRSGGCIIVVRSGSISEIDNLISDSDRLDKSVGSIKADTIKTMIGDKFQNLDRRLRQELLALDGATVITHKGTIIAVGAIISVPSGSEGGGRTAAAKKGSSVGLGIKISEDGGITVFNNEAHVFSA